MSNYNIFKFIAKDANVIFKLAKKYHLALYIGLVGYHNLGDEILFQAHKKLFSPHSLEPYRKDTFLVLKLANSLGFPFCKHAILGGGTLINDGDIWLAKAEYLINKSIKLYCLGTGVESPDFPGRSNNNILQRWAVALNKFEYVGVRGPLSKAVLEHAGVNNVIMTGDTALSLAEPINKHPNSGIIGICYGQVKGNSIWGDPDKYKEEIVKVIKYLITQNKKIVLLPVWGEDLKSNLELMAQINSPSCSIIEAYKDYKDYQRELKSCEFFVGQKLHGTIMALMNGIPSIMIEYRPKCLDFMMSINLETFNIKTSDFTLDTFKNKYETFSAQETEIMKKVELKIKEYQQIQNNISKMLMHDFQH